MEPLGTDFAADITTTGVIRLNEPVTGTVGIPGDRDWFAFTAIAGQTYQIDLRGAATQMGTLANPDIHGIYNAAGVLVPDTSNDSSWTRDFRQIYRAEYSGTHFIAAASVETTTGNAPREIGTYTLSIVPLRTLAGGPGDDWLLWQEDSSRPIEGGAGYDMLSFIEMPAGQIRFVDMWDGGAAFLTADQEYVRFHGFEAVTGTSYADNFMESGGNWWVRGMGGADTFQLAGGLSLSVGDAGQDTVMYHNPVWASLLRGRGWVGDAAGDRYAAIENLTGSYGNDTLTGDHGRNVLRGNNGNDLLAGNGGDDFIYGGGGSDVASFGFDHADYSVTTVGGTTRVTHLSGSGGTDTLTGIEILHFADGDVIL